MITPNGYSKDPGILPEAIVLTLPVQFFQKRNTTPAKFKKYFERYMARENRLWHFRLTNLPIHDIAWVYLIFDKKLQYQLNFVQYERNTTKELKDSPGQKVARTYTNSNWVVMCGPAIPCPFEREMRGFQGARYAIKLF